MWVKIGILFARLFGLLPLEVFSSIVSFLQKFSPYVAKRRLKIMQTNLKVCFPVMDPLERAQLIKKATWSVIYGGVETLISWTWSERRFKKNIHFRYEGYENLKEAQATGKGIILCGAHFTCLEIIGRIFGSEHPFDLVYQKHKNTIFEKWMTESRQYYVANCIERKDARGLVKSLRAGRMLWYPPDQDMAAERHVFVNFFGVPTATIVGTSRLAKLGRAIVLPISFYREKVGHYVLVIGKAFENFPSSSEEWDAQRYNQFVEEAVKKHPEQYLWSHRRFKTRPAGESSFYH